MKILITAGTTAQAHKLKRLLDKENTFVFADQDEMPAFASSSYRFIRIPPGDSFSFVHELLKNCLDEEIGFVYPLRKTEIKSLSEAVQLFEEYDVKVIIPSKEMLECIMDKPLVKGSLTVLIDGFVYASENDKNPESLRGLRNGVFMINPQNETDYSIFTAD